MEKIKPFVALISALLICLFLVTSCASYVVTGNWGGPSGGGLASPDGKRKAFVSVAVSDRSKIGELSPHLLRVWIVDAASSKVLEEKKAMVDGYYVRWNITWRDTATADFEFFDYGSTVVDLNTAKNATPAMKRVLATHALTSPLRRR